MAGLIFQGFPGHSKSTRQLQASSELFFDVFQKYDPNNLLLEQSRREVLEQELELTRLRETLDRIGRQRITMVAPSHPTPFAFSLMIARIREKLSTYTQSLGESIKLMIARIREKLSTEKVADRVQRMLAELEKYAAKG